MLPQLRIVSQLLFDRLLLRVFQGPEQVAEQLFANTIIHGRHGRLDLAHH